MFMLMVVGLFSGVWGLLYKHKHLLVMLLMIEYSVVSLFGMMMLLFSFLACDVYFMLLFLTLGVCEGAVGLGILVSMSRMFGNDYFSLISMLEC